MYRPRYATLGAACREYRDVVMTGVSRQRLISSEAPHHVSPIPQGVIGNGLIFLSALRGVDVATGNLAAGVEAQLRHAFHNMEVSLASAGVTTQAVLRVGVYAKNLASLRGVLDEVWIEVFGDDRPARFAVGVSDLGREGDDTQILLEVIALAPTAQGNL